MKVLLILILGILGKVLGDNVEDRRFAADLYEAVRDQDIDSPYRTFVICPLSVKLLLALIDLGAGGKTAEELSKGLELPNNSKDIQEYIKESLQIFGRDKHFKLQNANKIYVQKSFHINRRFKKLAKQLFHVLPFEKVDFKNVTNVVEKINTWIINQTHHNRTQIDKYILRNNVNIILANEMIYHGEWKNPFDSFKKRKFFWHKEGYYTLRMMHTNALFNYHKSKTFQATFLEVPTTKDNITLTIILPDDIEGLDGLIENLYDVLAPPDYSIRNVSVTLPRLHTSATIFFKPLLQKMGIREAFDSQKANFSGISDDPLEITDLYQELDFEMNSHNIFSMITTVAELAPITQRYKHSKSFVADHPFLFYLKAFDRIVFLGHFSGEGNDSYGN